MKIIQLTAENVKRLVAVSITPAGDVVVIGGKNGAGKSSVLDAIAMTIGGKAMVCDKPVRDGQESGWSTVKLDNGLTVRRNYNEMGTTSVTITDSNGAKFSSPQGILDKLTGDLTFDPMAFQKMKPLDQKAVLEKLAGLDFSKLDALYAGLYVQRAEMNRKAKALKAQYDAIPFVEDAPEELVDVGDLIRKLNDAYAVQVENERRRNALARNLEAGRLRAHRVEEVSKGIESLKEQLRNEEVVLENLKKQLAESRVEYAKENAEVSALVEPAITEIKQALDGAEFKNNKFKLNQGRAETLESLQAAEGEADSIASQMDALGADKLHQLFEARFPVDGLGISDDGITFNGIPWSQVNTGDQVRISVAMGMAMNPELRVLLIRDGSLMDEDTMAKVCAMAKDKDYQLWIETCHPDGMQAVIIEEGQIKP